jgi:hypothetical protein
MIPLRLGSTAGFEGAGGHERGHVCHREPFAQTDEALNLVTRVSDPSDASRTSDASTDLEGMDGMDDLDVATTLAGTGE